MTALRAPSPVPCKSRSSRGAATAVALALSGVLLSGCTATIGPGSFFPGRVRATTAAFFPPAGRTVEDAVLSLGGAGAVHAVRVQSPAADCDVLYSGGNDQYVAELTGVVAGLTAATGCNVVAYDYPGRGGTVAPLTVDGLLAFDAALVETLRRRGWVGPRRLFAYGVSFGGGQAAVLAAQGGFDGLIIEGSAPDFLGIGRDLAPALMRPFLRLKLDPDLARFDMYGFVREARAPVLLISSREDQIVRPRRMAALARRLAGDGIAARLVVVPGPHAAALREPTTRDALRAFTSPRAP